jgi:uncharacterized protein YfaP (DUF2135 family)
MTDEDFFKFANALELFGPRIPAMCTGPDGRVMLSWDNEEHHLELELFADQPAEIFYRNRKTEEMWGIDLADV